MRIIESGKHSGKILVNCPPEYLEWASKHEKNFAERNRWISRDAKFLLERANNMAEIIEVGNIEIAIEASGNIQPARWQKYGNDRLYLGGKNNPFIDLSDAESVKDREFSNPYGWNTERIIENGQIAGRIHRNSGAVVAVRW